MKMWNREKEMGLECNEHEDGSKTCRRIKRKKGKVFGTGTEVELVADPNTCKVRRTGRVMDEDKESVEQEVNELESRCKKGF